MPEHEFKVGDWVECVEAKPASGADTLLVKGNFYKVVELSTSVDCIKVDGIKYSFDRSRFKPAIPEVGSRWVGKKNNLIKIVVFSDNESVVAKSGVNGQRALWTLQEFLEWYEPEPKTTVRYRPVHDGGYTTLDYAKDSTSDAIGFIKIETDSNGKTTVTQVDLENENE